MNQFEQFLGDSRLPKNDKTMTQFNFTTNIEKRTTDTGKVFFVDRMTSDYATAHPLDVDGFIESVYQEFKGTEFEEPREVLRKVWVDVMSDMNPRGNASLFPTKDGQKRAAAMKVWHLAGDYWRRGLRITDTLPCLVPGCKITRLEDGGWIALFPKDEHLLTTTDLTDYTDKNVVITAPVIDEPAEPQSEQPEPKPEPRQLDLFAMQARPQRRRRASKPAQSVVTTPLHQQGKATPLPKQGKATGRRVSGNGAGGGSVALEQSDELQGLKNVGKALAIVIGLSAVLVVLWQTGLIIPLGLIGLGISGFLR